MATASATRNNTTRAVVETLPWTTMGARDDCVCCRRAGPVTFFAPIPQSRASARPGWQQPHGRLQEKLEDGGKDNGQDDLPRRIKGGQERQQE